MAESATRPPWLLLHSKPRAEVLARTHLERQGFEVFLPRIERHWPGAQGMRRRIEVLFPRYLFVRRPESAASWAAARSTRGVSGLVRFGEHPAEVPISVVDALLRLRDPTSDLLRPDVPRLRRGQRVRVEDGPFAGLSGIFDEDCGLQRVRILLVVLGLERSVVLPVACLSAA